MHVLVWKTIIHRRGICSLVVYGIAAYSRLCIGEPDGTAEEHRSNS